MFLATSGVAGEHREMLPALLSHLWRELPNSHPQPHIALCALGTHNLFSLSFSLIFFRTLISSLAASRYFPTFFMIFSATCDLPLEREETEGWSQRKKNLCAQPMERGTSCYTRHHLSPNKTLPATGAAGQWLIGSDSYRSKGHS